MISISQIRNVTDIRDGYGNQSDTNSKEELTLITANNLTERAASIIDDDVGPDINLDFIPVKEYCKDNLYATIIPSKEIEIIDVPEKITSYEDKSSLFQCEDSVDGFHNPMKKMIPKRDVDEYDLENINYGFHESNKYCEDLVRTIQRRRSPSVVLTRHEISSRPDVLQLRSSPCSSPHRAPVETRHSPVTTDIGKQITQLARRIESLGNISRLCQDDIENYPGTAALGCYHADDQCHHPGDCCGHTVPDQHQIDNYSLKAARKLDEIGRLQKKQEAMQNRLVDLARRLNDSTRDLTRIASPEPFHDDYSPDNDYFHGKLTKSSKKSRKSNHKSRKHSKMVPKQSSSSFLKNILNDNNEPKTNELPLLSSSYCLHNDLSTGSPETGISESTSKFLNEELTNIRQEFRTQVEEIRKLLSDRYHQSVENSKPSLNVEGPHQCPYPCTHSSVHCHDRIHRDISPSLRNITNLNNNNSEDCPLDKYLMKCGKTAELPTHESESVPSLRPGILPSVARAIKSKQRMLSDPVEAEKFLIELSNRRANLENNLSCLERAKEGEFLFSILEKLQSNDNNVEIARIQAMVDDAISSMSPIVKQEVRQEILIWSERLKEQREQQLIEEEKERQTVVKVKSAKPIRFHTDRKCVPNPSASSVPGRPWVCKKYLSVKSRIDSGVRKFPEETISWTNRSHSPSKKSTLPPANTHTAWSNRRRYRSPYLHFINDVKLAKKPVVPLGEARKAPPANQWTKKSETRTTKSSKRTPSDDLVLMSVKQYSLDYKETPRYEPEPIPSPTISERGTGFEVMSKPSMIRREERVGPFAPFDPIETTRIVTNPVVVTNKPEPKPQGPDLNNLRHLIERALLDHIEIPSPVVSIDRSELITKIENVPTPLPTDGIEDYSDHFSPEDLDETMSPMENVRTPEMSQVISEYSFKPSRVSTPSRSHVSSEKIVAKKSPKHEMVSEAVQTICNASAQTEEHKEVQAKPITTFTQTHDEARPPSEKGSSTSSFNGSLSDTQVQSWSDGMWLYDRSEGEMAPIQIDTVDRWQMGACPDNPLWYNGTNDLMHMDRHSSLSFGEFTKPTLPGLIPTQDPVLQLKTLPFKQPPTSPGVDEDNDEFMYLSHRQTSSPNPFRSLGVSRDSKSRQYQSSPSNFANSEGEIILENDPVDGDVINEEYAEEEDEIDTRPGRNHFIQDSHDSRHSSPKVMDMKRSNESPISEKDMPNRNSQSDRMSLDVQKYLRASKQSHSDMSDTGGLMSTGQLLASAFRGGDSADFDGYSDNFLDRHVNENRHNTKPPVTIPTSIPIERSESSSNEDNLEIIDLP